MGFTLIETLITICVFVLIAGALSSVTLYIYKTQKYVWQQSIAINEARRGIETMAREIREAKNGDSGSYAIELAGDKEFIFYSDIDKDGETERVRYSFGSVDSQIQTKECQSSISGGICSVDFSNFLNGDLISGSIKISVDGDFGWDNQEYVDIYIDGNFLTRICQTGCVDCGGTWQGTTTFDVKNFLSDDSVVFLAESSWRVDPICSSIAMKVNFELSLNQETVDSDNEFKKGVTDPTGTPPQYLDENEEIFVLSKYVRNPGSIFKYFDKNGDQIVQYPARLVDTKMMQLELLVDVDPDYSPNPFELISSVQLRNLK